MGLDMYLNARKYLSLYSDAELIDQIDDVLDVGGDKEKAFNGVCMSAGAIELRGMYWRKANAIHAWFVDNVQDGEDDCKRYYVSREQMQELINECLLALQNPAESNNLEPRAGFFFGSTEKNEWYIQDLNDTVKGLTKLLELPADYDFFYVSSW
jgi:hypothetical protein